MLIRIRELLKRRSILILLILILLGLAAFLLNDFIQEQIAPPLLAWMWGVYIMSSGFPQVMTWAFFIAAIPVIAIFSLIQGRPSLEEEDEGWYADSTGQVQMLARWIQQAPDGEFFRMRLVRHLSGLTLDALAYKERQSADEIKEALGSGEIEVDADVYELLRQGWSKRPYGSTSARSWRRPHIGREQPERLDSRPTNSKGAPWHDPQMEKMIQYLEKELTIESAVLPEVARGS